MRVSRGRVPRYSNLKGARTKKDDTGMKYRDLIKEIEGGRVIAAYLFEGEEDYLKEEALKKLREILIFPGYEDFDYEDFSCRDTSISHLLESVNTFPFRGKRRLVIVRDMDECLPDYTRALVGYLDHPVPSTCLVSMGRKFNRKTKFYRSFGERGKIVSFYPLRDEEVVDWIKERVRNEGKKISPQAGIYLQERVGNDLHSLTREIEKLVLFSHPKDFIEKEDVENLVGKGTGPHIFDLTKAIRERRVAAALSSLSQLLDRGEKPTRIHALIAREIRILLRLKEKGGRTTPDEACSIIFPGKGHYARFYWDIARSYIQASKEFTQQELINGYHRLVEAEVSIKTGREDQRRALEKMILDFLVREDIRSGEQLFYP
jgi:DNA polymerase-3 subunit delta